MKKKEKIKFKIGREQTGGLPGFIVSILAVLATAVLIFISARKAGEAGKWLAVAAIVINLAAILGFIYTLKALYTRDNRRGLSIAALTLDGLTVIFYISVYIMGF